MEKAQKALLGVVDLQADPEALCALSYLATRESDSKEARAQARAYTVQAMYLGMKKIFRETGDRLRMLGSDFIIDCVCSQIFWIDESMIQFDSYVWDGLKPLHRKLKLGHQVK